VAGLSSLGECLQIRPEPFLEGRTRVDQIIEFAE